MAIMDRRFFMSGLMLVCAACPARAGGSFAVFSREGLVKLAPDGGLYGRYARRLLATLPPEVHPRPDLERTLNRLASEARVRAGRRALKPSRLALLAARGQAADMMLGNYVGHHSPSGFSFARRFEAAAGAHHGNHAENAARDRQHAPVDDFKAARLFRQWMDSSGHLQNLMRREWRYVCTGALARGHALYAVQIYWEK